MPLSECFMDILLYEKPIHLFSKFLQCIQGVSWEPWKTLGNYSLGQYKKKSPIKEPNCRNEISDFYSLLCTWGSLRSVRICNIDLKPKGMEPEIKFKDFLDKSTSCHFIIVH